MPTFWDFFVVVSGVFSFILLVALIMVLIDVYKEDKYE